MRLASTKTLEARSARMAMTMTLPGSAGGSMTAEGLEDFTQQNLSMTLKFPAMGGAQAKPMQMEQRLIGGVMYMKADVFAQGLAPGRTWVKMDLNALSQKEGFPLADLLKQARNSDPGGQVNFLRGVQGDVVTVGHEVVRGAETTHYKVTVDVQKAGEQLPADLREKIKPLFDQLQLKTFPAEVWMDDQNRARKVTYTLDLSKAAPPAKAGKAAQASTGPITMTMEFFDFGVKVDISAPPASQVADFEELKKGWTCKRSA